MENSRQNPVETHRGQSSGVVSSGVLSSMAVSERPVVAIYPRHWLTTTMTFVYRQLMAVRGRFDPIVLATSTENRDLFPFSPVFEKRINLFDRHYSRLMRFLLQRYSFPSCRHLRYWRSILRQHRVRLIHAHFGFSGMDMLPLARELGLPLLVTFHGYDISKLMRNRRYRSDLRRLLRYAYCVAVSKRFADRLVSFGADPSRVKVHYVGAPLEDFPPVKRTPMRAKIAQGEPIRFLQVSSLSKKKGHLYTVEAFSRFLRKHPLSVLTLAGGGPLRGQIEDRCRSLGISEKVVFTGPVDKKEVLRLLHQADVFLHHSVTPEDGNEEGATTAIVEAMSTRLPVISSFHGGIPELVRDGIDGFLVAERDIDSYADRMERILDFEPPGSNEWLRENFDLTRNMQSLMDLYQNLIEGRLAP